MWRGEGERKISLTANFLNCSELTWKTKTEFFLSVRNFIYTAHCHFLGIYFHQQFLNYVSCFLTTAFCINNNEFMETQRENMLSCW